LTIGYKQTISQPYIVAKMTELLISHTKARGKILNNVLELGTGCGYQTAVLSYFCENIYSIERIKPLVNKARENLNELKIRNVELIYGDGFEDWDNTIKYDGVICAAAPREYPHELVDSLNVSAKIVIPVGNSKSQKLNVINKISSNEVEQDLYDDVSFVPMLPGKSEDGLDS
jgi:protein-L-isoaspartate(D-aspartate) O-methyltransferase